MGNVVQKGQKEKAAAQGDVSAASMSILLCATRAGLAGVVSALSRLTEPDRVLPLACGCFFMQMRIKRS